MRWASAALGDFVCTTMPSVTCVLQAIWSFGIFSTSTMAHAAVAVHRQVGVPAEVGDVDSQLLRRPG